MNLRNVWVVDDDASIRWVLERALASADMQVTCFDSADSVLQALEQQAPEVIVSDIRMPGLDGLGLLAQVQESYPHIPIVIMTAHSDLESAVAS